MLLNKLDNYVMIRVSKLSFSNPSTIYCSRLKRPSTTYNAWKFNYEILTP